MNPTFDYLIFIGRFQPFHLAHQAVIEQAFKCSQNVIILLGSANAEGLSETSFFPDLTLGTAPIRTSKNIFTASEREQMIRAAFSTEQQAHLFFAALIDVHNDEKWTKMVKAAVASIVPSQSKKVGLIGHFKDQSSYYLALFPEWPLVELDNFYHLSATPMREHYLQGQLPSLTEVPMTTLQFLTQFQTTPCYQQLELENAINLKQANSHK